MNKKGFTLIELLAVIIILGIVMIIAIPSVTKYISDSRKESYIDTARELIGSARNFVNEGKLGMYDTNVTYYIDIKCIKTENASKSPYGEFKKAYVVVTYDGKGYDYYWTSVDEAGQGIKTITRMDKLDSEKIESDLKESDILNSAGIDERNKYVIIDERTNCGKGIPQNVNDTIDGETGKKLACKRAKTVNQEKCLGGPCNSFGYVYGDTVTYGQVGTSGKLGVGDAFICDVNYDGTFDSQDERFYYVTTNSTNAVLIYYRNITNQTAVAYDANGSQLNGPRTAAQYLPTTTTWKNPLIVAPGKKQIVNEYGTTSGGSVQYTTFNYEGKAARLLTYQEINTLSSTPTGYGALSNYTFLFENTFFSNSSLYSIAGYWLENPRGCNNGCNLSLGIHGGAALVDTGETYGIVTQASYYGVRPVIEVNLNNVGY